LAIEKASHPKADESSWSVRAELATPPEEVVMEKQFLRFREVATDFVKELNADFTAGRDSSKAVRFNLQIIRKVFSKWSIEILILLYSLRIMGFEELRKSLEGVSARILSDKLKTLEKLGLVERRIISARPPRVHYKLTEKGLTVAEIGQPVLLYLRYSEGLYA